MVNRRLLLAAAIVGYGLCCEYATCGDVSTAREKPAEKRKAVRPAPPALTTNAAPTSSLSKKLSEEDRLAEKVLDLIMADKYEEAGLAIKRVLHGSPPEVVEWENFKRRSEEFARVAKELEGRLGNAEKLVKIVEAKTNLLNDAYAEFDVQAIQRTLVARRQAVAEATKMRDELQDEARKWLKTVIVKWINRNAKLMGSDSSEQ